MMHYFGYSRWFSIANCLIIRGYITPGSPSQRAQFEGLDEGSRSFADYLRTSDHLRWARTIEKGTRSFLMHICRVQSQVPFSGVCAHLRDLGKNGTGTYHWEVTGICVQTSEQWISINLPLHLKSCSWLVPCFLQVWLRSNSSLQKRCAKHPCLPASLVEKHCEVCGNLGLSQKRLEFQNGWLTKASDV